jgi:DNA-binding transcriptional MerR regulator
MEYTVKDLARIFGTTVGGIRFFEDAGMVHPQRKANGYRVYTLEDILELYYVRKYCSLGLKINEASEYFGTKNTKAIGDIAGLLADKQREVEWQVQYYKQALRWLIQYREKIDNLDSYCNDFRPVKLPAQYLLPLEDILAGGTNRHQDIVRQWIAAVPISQISIIGRWADSKLSARWEFTIDKKSAVKLRLPLDRPTRVFSGGLCLYRILKLPVIEKENLPVRESIVSLIRQIETMDYIFSGRIISRPLYAHTLGGVSYWYFEIGFFVRKIEKN